MPVSGECFCGGIAYTVDGTLKDPRSCHCSRCRKAFSAQASAYAEVNPDGFQWLKGKQLLKAYEGKQGFGLLFCRQCGSTLCGTYQGKLHGISLGCLNEDPGIKIGHHFYLGSKAGWELLPEGIHGYDEGLG